MKTLLIACLLLAAAPACAARDMGCDDDCKNAFYHPHHPKYWYELEHQQKTGVRAEKTAPERSKKPDTAVEPVDTRDLPEDVD